MVRTANSYNYSSYESSSRISVGLGAHLGLRDSYNIGIMRRISQSLLLCFFVLLQLHGEGPAFDLAGPKVDVHVKRGDITLPISQVPNLLPGDRIWVHPDLPESQSTHFVLVIAFLRGSTNPPPNSWFTRVETWNPAALGRWPPWRPRHPAG